MKKQKKMMLLAASALLASNLSFADDNFATQTFQWSGEVPPIDVSNGVRLVNKGGSFDGGSLAIIADENETGHYMVRNSSKMIFTVEADDGSGNWSDIDTYDYTLESMSYSLNGFFQEVDSVNPEFALNNGTDEINVRDTVSVVDSLDTVQLEVISPTSFSANSGENLQVRASILVNNINI